MLKLRSHSVDETREIAGALARVIAADDVILLLGDMGAGKTAFAQGFGEGLGVDEAVTSPTFNLVHTYDTGRLVMHHADLYRLDRTGEVSDLALAELDGVLLIEWGEPASGLIGDHLVVHLEFPDRATLDEADRHHDDDESGRILSMTPCGHTWTRRWPKIEAALRPWTCSGDAK